MQNIIEQESRSFLQALCSGGSAIASAHPEPCPSERAFRPASVTSGRSPYLLRRVDSGREKQYTLITSGVSACKVFGIIDLLKPVCGEAHTTAVDEAGKVFADDTPETRKAIAQMKVTFKNGTQLHWTAVSGFQLYCPTAKEFDALCAAFPAPTPSVAQRNL